MRKTALFCLFLWGSAACNKQVLVITTAIPTDSVQMSVDPNQPGIVIPPGFAGLSLETSVLTGSALNGDNTDLIKMVKLLGPYGQLRIGGGSEDQIFWAEKARGTSKDVDSLYTTDLVNLFAFARAVGWKVTLGLNFAQSPETVDASEATYALNAGGSFLYALEIGNAPDQYDSLNLKPTPYTYLDFQAQWLSYAEAIQANTKGGFSFEGPSTAASTDSWLLPFIGAEYTHLVAATRHYYRVSSPASTNATIAHLLGTRDDNFFSQVTQSVAACRTANLPFRIDQCNAIDDGGKKDVSNTMGIALWGLDLLYTLAQEGVSGVNFSGSLTDQGSPIALSGSSPTAGPLFYAMLCFQLGSQGKFIPVNLSNPGGVNLTAYAVVTSNGGMYLTLINKEKSTNANVFINCGKALQSAQYLYLTAPSQSATSGITLGGATVKSDGTLSQTPHFNPLPFGMDSTAITVPYSSALILELQ